MPIYAYRCSQCGFEKDVLQKMSDPPLTTCPECNTENFSQATDRRRLSIQGQRLVSDRLQGRRQTAAKSDNPPPCQGGTGSCACN